MNTLLRFERKFGWAEVISTAALIFSLLSLWYTRLQVVQSLPELAIDSEPAVRLVDRDQKISSELVVLLPFTVTNRGGRAATLVRFERGNISPVLRVVDGKISEEHGLDISFAFIEGTPSSMRQLRDTITEAELRRLALPSVVNQTIDSGRSKSFVMYLRMRDRNGASLEGTQVLFSCNAVFSDGTKHHIAQGIGFND